MPEKLWFLRDYVTATGKREVRKHYERASDNLKAEFDLHWELLEVRTRDQWVRPAAHKLEPEFKNGFRDFFEFRFFAERVQQRPLGFFWPGPKDFTVLLWAIEKGHGFDPKDAYKICCRRRESLLSKTATSVPWDDDEINDEADKTSKAAAQSVPKRLR